MFLSPQAKYFGSIETQSTFLLYSNDALYNLCLWDLSLRCAYVCALLPFVRAIWGLLMVYVWVVPLRKTVCQSRFCVQSKSSQIHGHISQWVYHQQCYIVTVIGIQWWGLRRGGLGACIYVVLCVNVWDDVRVCVCRCKHIRGWRVSLEVMITQGIFAITIFMTICKRILKVGTVESKLYPITQINSVYWLQINLACLTAKLRDLHLMLFLPREQITLAVRINHLQPPSWRGKNLIFRQWLRSFQLLLK